jgi:cell division septum initiation protein DivIVA
MTEIILSQWVIAFALGALCLTLIFFCLVPALLIGSRVRKMKGTVGAMREETAEFRRNLAADLSQVLERLSEKQIEASKRQQAELGEQLTSSLRVPLENVVKSLEHYGRSQSDGVAKGLEQQMTVFANRLDQLLGGQVAQAKDLQTQTLRSLETTIAAFQDMARTMGNTAQSASHAMVKELRAGISRSQVETSANISELINKLGSQVTAAVAALEKQAETTTSTALVQQQKIAEEAQRCVDALTEEVRSQTQAVESAAENMRTAGIDVADAVDRIIEGMTGLISGAAQEIMRSGAGFTEIFEKSTTLHGELQETATALAESSKDIGVVVTDYRTARETLDSLIEMMRQTAEAARKDNSLTAETVANIEAAAQKLVSAQGQADDYLAKLSTVLAEAHTNFSTEMLETVRDFHEHLMKTPTANASPDEAQRRSSEFDRMISDWVQATPRLKRSVTAPSREERVTAGGLPLPATRVVGSK